MDRAGMGLDPGLRGVQNHAWISSPSRVKIAFGWAVDRENPSPTHADPRGSHARPAHTGNEPPDTLVTRRSSHVSSAAAAFVSLAAAAPTSIPRTHVGGTSGSDKDVEKVGERLQGIGISEDSIHTTGDAFASNLEGVKRLPGGKIKKKNCAFYETTAIMFGRGSPRINLMQSASIQKKEGTSTMVGSSQQKGTSPQANGWTSEAWNRIVKQFLEKFTYVTFSRTQIQEKEKELKRDYMTLKEARKQSGASWNERLGMIEAEPAVWDNIIQSHPKAKKFVTKPFPLFESLGDLYDA
ncbi:hypothetical protein ACP4OV_006048 [Aristida adscensionis]